MMVHPLFSKPLLDSPSLRIGLDMSEETVRNSDRSPKDEGRVQTFPILEGGVRPAGTRGIGHSAPAWCVSGPWEGKNGRLSQFGTTTGTSGGFRTRLT